MPPYDMPPMVTYEQGGGLNEGIPASEIAQNESPRLENFYPFGRKIIRRGGIRRVTSAAYYEDLMSLFPFRTKTGAWTLIVGGLSSFGKVSGAGFLVIPNITGLSILPVAVPWGMFQYNDIAYAARRGDGRLYRVTPDYISTAGIASPPTAPTIAQGDAGALAAGDYAAVSTFANSITGVESNPSPKSNVLSLGSLRKINYTGIATSLNPQVDSRRIYRTLIDQVNEYFYVATLPNNIATTFTGEETLPEDMGDAVLFTNYLPPSLLRWVTSWKERAFGTDGTDIFYTNLNTMEGWTGDVIPVFRDDGHEVRVLCPYGDRLIIGKTNKVHFLIGTDRSTFQVLTLSDKHGCMAPHSMKVAEGLLFWYGSGKNFYRSDGNNTVGIGDIKIRKILDAIPDSLQEHISAEVYPTLSQYVVSIPRPDSTNNQNKMVLVYNYRTDAWTTYTHSHPGGLGGDAPGFVAEFFDQSFGRALYGTMYNGHVYHLYDPQAGYDYFQGNPIAAKMLTRQENGGTVMSKALRRVHLLCSSVAEQVTLAAYRDGRSVPSVLRTASLNVDAAWKAVNLSTLGDPGSTVQVELTYTGTAALELEAVGLELELIERFFSQPQ